MKLLVVLSALLSALVGAVDGVRLGSVRSPVAIAAAHVVAPVRRTAIPALALPVAARRLVRWIRGCAFPRLTIEPGFGARRRV